MMGVRVEKTYIFECSRCKRSERVQADAEPPVPLEWHWFYWPSSSGLRPENIKALSLNVLCPDCFNSFGDWWDRKD